MGEPAIPPARRRIDAIHKARAIIQAVRDDEPQDVYRVVALQPAVVNFATKEAQEETDALIMLMASEIDLLNTALQRACAAADELNGDNGDDDELVRRRAEIAELRAVGLPVVFCAHCHKRPATCTGNYEDHAAEDCPAIDAGKLCGQHGEQPACDECCGHACEDGHCTPIEGPALVLEVEG